MSDNNTKRGTGEKAPNDPRKQADLRKNDPESQTTPSLASRIQNSAAGLARSAFNATASSADAAHVLASGSKAGPSSSASTSALAAAEHYRETATPTSSTRAHSSNNPAASFRSSSTGQQGAFELPPLTEDEFQRAYDESQVHSNIDFSPSTETDTGKGKGKASKTPSSFSNLEPSSSSSALNSAWQTALPSTATTLPSDGEAVVSLLSDASFNPEFPPSAEEPFEPIETELLPPQLTPSEIEMIESFRRHAALESSTPIPAAEPSSQTQTHRLTSLSLVPDIESVLDSVPAAQGTDATALRDAVLMGLPGAAEWIAVEERYHDEVWGYLRPTLEAAAKEMEANKEQGAPVEDGPAVRRLKMILRHMQA